MTDSLEKQDRFVSDGGLSEEFKQCDSCGATLPNDEWCPTVTDTDAEGELVIRSFCDQECKNAWTDR